MENPAEQIQLSWRRHALGAIGLELDVMDGPAVSEGAAGEILYAIQEEGGVKLRVAAGPGSDLAGWRSGYAARAPRIGAESRLTVCGVPARRQEAEVAAESATGSVRGADGAIGHIDASKPAVVAVAVAFAIAGRPVLVEWVVPADGRERYRAAEKRFFASLTCPARDGGG